MRETNSETQLRGGLSPFEFLGKMEQRVEVGSHVGDLRIEAPKIDHPLGGIRASRDQLLPIFERVRPERKLVVFIDPK